MLGVFILRDDAITRAMMWVVAHHIYIGVVPMCVGSIVLNSCFACSYCGWAEMSFL